MRFPRTSRAALALLALALVVSACEDETTAPEDDPIEGELTIDASDPIGFTYFTFADGGSVLTVADPGSSTEWDMAFRRFTVKLNGGVSGPGDVEGANLENNAALDSAAVLALTLSDADADFEAVTETDIAGAAFIEDGLVEDATAWLTFGATGPQANPQEAWKVRLADGEHAVLRAIGFTFGGAATFEVRHQPSGGTLSAIDTVTADVSMGPVWIDLETGASVGPTGAWDFSLDPGAEITLNATAGAGTFPIDAAEDFSALTAADDAPEYGAFLSSTAGAFPSSFSGPEGVFWYNIDGSMRLFPTYNVFLVRVGSEVYKVQVTDYYNSTGDSGFPTVRFEQIQ